MVCRLEEKGNLTAETANKLRTKLILLASIALEEVEQEGVFDTGDDVDRFHRSEEVRELLRQGMEDLFDWEEKGIFTAQDVDDFVVDSMLILEMEEFVTRNVAYEARGVLSSIAEERGIEMRKPN